MRIVTDVNSFMEQVDKSIKMYGNFPENNFYHYINSQEDWIRNAVIDFGRNRIILASYEDDIWKIFPEGVLCSKEEKVRLISEFCDFFLVKKGCNKVMIELQEDNYKELKFQIEKGSDGWDSVKIDSIEDTYYCPVVDLNLWNSKLEGSGMYELRKIKNNFCKKYSLKVSDAAKLKKEYLLTLLDEWRKNRKAKDEACIEEYKKFIETGFKGTDYAICILVDGKPHSLIAGWKIPNTENFYMGISLHNYKSAGIGEVSYIEFLNELKQL